MSENTVLQVKSACYNPTLWDIRYQILTSNIAFLFTIHAGINLAFSNLLLNEFDKETSSWFASIVALSTPVGAVVCGPLMDKIGRKGGNMMIAVPCVCTWLLMGFANKNQTALLYFGRFLSGFAGGLTTTNMVYVSETTHKKYRSMFLALLGIHFSFGILLTTILQAFFTWKQNAFIFAIFFVIVACMVALFTPESPIWLANFRLDINAAKKSLKRLNPNIEVFEEELRQLKNNMNPTQDNNKGHRWIHIAVFKPIASLLGLIFLQQLSGIYPLIFYAYNIFPLVSPKFGATVRTEAFIMFGVVRFVASLISCFLSIRVGRRKLLMFSSAGMLVVTCLFLINQWSPTVDCPRIKDLREWFSLILFISFVGIGAIGVMTIPWTLIVELLPLEKRGIGGACLISYSYLNLFLCTKTFPFILDTIGITILFGVFALISLCITIFVYILIPETLGRTLAEIEMFYMENIKDVAA